MLSSLVRLITAALGTLGVLPTSAIAPLFVTEATESVEATFVGGVFIQPASVRAWPSYTFVLSSAVIVMARFRIVSVLSSTVTSK